jgi:hypothetical protein
MKPTNNNTAKKRKPQKYLKNLVKMNIFYKFKKNLRDFSEKKLSRSRVVFWPLF